MTPNTQTGSGNLPLNFWSRLKDFVANVQINDMMSWEEKEMIMRVCDQQPAPDSGEIERIASDAWDKAVEAVEEYFENDFDENGPIPQFSIPESVKADYIASLSSPTQK